MESRKKIVVLGAGESGVGAAILAQKKGMDVWVSDKSKIKDKYLTILKENKIQFEQEQHTEEKILAADEIIKSPGIPETAPIIVKLKKKGTPVISEIEFAGRYTDAKKICITGSNGKTTTTMLTYHIFKKAGLNVGLAGNVGKSFAYQVATENFDYYVLELSSFQLDDMYNFKADVAILLNITPDHLDRYDHEMQNYTNSKFITKTTSSDVDFGVPSRPAMIHVFEAPEFKSRVDLEWIGKQIPVDDARWIGTVLARLSPEQIQAAFGASGYSPKEVVGFSAVVEARIAELNKL